MLLDASRDDAHRDREYILCVPRHEDPFDYAVESGDEYGDACTEHDIPARVRAMAERELQTAQHRHGKETGRASCRERACQYVQISMVAVSLTKKHQQHYTH